ncbi:MAG: XdhC family protein [Bacteroidota bacterium]
MKEIRQIIQMYDTTDWTTEKAALATVVDIEASTYRRIGARMYVKSSGNWIGGISGGCLEGDALSKAQQAIYHGKPSIVTYDTLEDEDAHEIGVGLGCNGRIDVFFCPIDPEEQDNPIEQLRHLIDRRQPSIICQLLDPDHWKMRSLLASVSSEIQDVAAELMVAPVLLEEIIQQVHYKKKSKVYPIPSTQRKLLIEFLQPEIHLVLVGDNYDADTLVRIAHELGWKITVIGLRRKMNPVLFGLAKQVLEYDQINQVTIDPYTAVVLMSHDYDKDLKMLRHFIRLPISYIGMLGPRRRREKMMEESGELLSDLPQLTYFFNPIGLDIGAETPEEIAISITSEIISVFRQRDGRSLRLRPGTIHVRE